MRIVIVAALAACVGGCVTTGSGDVINFQPKSYQQAVMREGDAVISSRGKYSTVTLRSAAHLVTDHPVFIVGIENVSKYPLDFRVTDAVAGQIVSGSKTQQLKIYTYDELASQERNAQVGRALLVAALSGVNSGLVGEANAADANAQMQASVAMQGQQNMAELEQLAIKDHTLMPGESYAGKLYLESPANADGPKSYFIALKVGPDRHDFEVVQSPAVR